MQQVLLKQGTICVEEVPPPSLEKGSVLVQVSHSCISTGTELHAINSSRVSLLNKAFKHRQSIVGLLRTVHRQGIAAATTQVHDALSTSIPLGYSASGVVIAVGEDIVDLPVGTRVACAGAQCAYHAEIIRVPRLLTVSVPSSVADAPASTVALGGIALQGLRRAAPLLGERIAVLGLGILGQLTVQLLKANGCEVIGIDPDQIRVDIAERFGLDWGYSPSSDTLWESVNKITGGNGVDAAIITASSSSSNPIGLACRLCRKKGRLIIVGDVGLSLKREDIYRKELDLLISTSYGPGRYDPSYEEHGQDYPFAYVRWTEQRNMHTYIQLLEQKRILLDDLLTHVFPLPQADKAYHFLATAKPKPILVLLRSNVCQPVQELSGNATVIHSSPAPCKGKIRIAVIGTGSFARSVHLPNLLKLSAYYSLRAVVSRSGHSAADVARRFSAQYSTSNLNTILEDPEIDAVIIATRHHLHAGMALSALKAGKHVLVEKPLALTDPDLQCIREFYNQSESNLSPVLMTGFNRRFSPLFIPIVNNCKKRCNPLMIHYRVNAGCLPNNHWVFNPEEGGRNLGEACHFYDLFTALTGSRVGRISVMALPTAPGYSRSNENFLATIAFEEGSVASLQYTSLGHEKMGKERLEVMTDHKSFVISDFHTLQSFGETSISNPFRRIQKGHLEELQAFAQTVRSGGQWPIPLWEQLQATEIALHVEQLLRSGDSPPTSPSQ